MKLGERSIGHSKGNGQLISYLVPEVPLSTGLSRSMEKEKPRVEKNLLKKSKKKKIKLRSPLEGRY